MVSTEVIQKAGVPSPSEQMIQTSSGFRFTQALYVAVRADDDRLPRSGSRRCRRCIQFSNLSTLVDVGGGSGNLIATLLDKPGPQAFCLNCHMRLSKPLGG